MAGICSSPTCGCTAAPLRCGATCRSSSSWCSTGRSVRERCSTSRCRSRRWPRATVRWTSGARSRRCSRSDAPMQGRPAVKIRIEIGGTSLTATLNDSEAARDFASLLPLTVTLEDYVETEKVATLPRKLSTTGAPSGSDPDVGDIAYYAPWGNLAIYYRDFGYSAGLVKLGRIDSGVETLARAGNGRATIARIEP